MSLGLLLLLHALLFLPSSKIFRDPKSQQTPYRNERYNRLLIPSPNPYGILVWDILSKGFSLILNDGDGEIDDLGLEGSNCFIFVIVT